VTVKSRHVATAPSGHNALVFQSFLMSCLDHLVYNKSTFINCAWPLSGLVSSQFIYQYYKDEFIYHQYYKE
jgi:hypothetical protein